MDSDYRKHMNDNFSSFVIIRENLVLLSRKLLVPFFLGEEKVFLGNFIETSSTGFGSCASIVLLCHFLLEKLLVFGSGSDEHVEDGELVFITFSRMVRNN